MHRDGLEARGVHRREQRGHARARGESDQGDAFAVGALEQAHLIDGGEDQRGLGLRATGLGVEPVPAALRVGQAALFRIKHQEALARGEPVHPRAAREVGGILPAAVQHHHQRQALAHGKPRRTEEPEPTHARAARGDPRDQVAESGRGMRRRLAHPAHQVGHQIGGAGAPGLVRRIAGAAQDLARDGAQALAPGPAQGGGSGRTFRHHASLTGFDGRRTTACPSCVWRVKETNEGADDTPPSAHRLPRLAA